MPFKKSNKEIQASAFKMRSSLLASGAKGSPIQGNYDKSSPAKLAFLVPLLTAAGGGAAAAAAGTAAATTATAAAAKAAAIKIGTSVASSKLASTGSKKKGATPAIVNGPQKNIMNDEK